MPNEALASSDSPCAIAVVSGVTQRQVIIHYITNANHLDPTLRWQPGFNTHDVRGLRSESKTLRYYTTILHHVLTNPWDSFAAELAPGLPSIIQTFNTSDN